MSIGKNRRKDNSGTKTDCSKIRTRRKEADAYEILDLDGRSQNRYVCNNPAIVSDRYRVSSRATAAIVNAALEDMRILRDKNKLDRKKVMREKLRVGKTNILSR